MDIFIEHIVERKKSIKDFLAIAGIFLVTVVLMCIAGLFLFTKYGSLVFLLTIGIVLGSYYLITMFNVEYEYIVTNGEMDVDTIINRKKRKRIITVAVKTFELVAPVGDKEFSTEENGSFTREINVSSAKNGENAYYAIFSKDGQRIKLIFEPTEKMLEAFKFYAARRVHTK